MPMGIAPGVSGLTATASNRYPLVALSSITLVERPCEGHEDEQLFFNPRSLDSFDSEEMEKLRLSIARDGLIHPPTVRIVTRNGKRDGEVVRIDLIAGERRVRSLMYLYEVNEPVFDDAIGDFSPARDIYEYISCKVKYNITDQEALGLSYVENAERKSLTLMEEINLVERLVRRGMSQDEIARTLRRQVPWVSQTTNFRLELPAEAFAKVVCGKLSRNVAIRLMSYSPEDRERVFAASLAEEVKQRDSRRVRLADALEVAEVEADLRTGTIEDAEFSGDLNLAVKERKRLSLVNDRVSGLQKKQRKLEKEVGTIRQGHVMRAAAAQQVVPRRTKALDRDAIETFFIKRVTELLGRVDSVTGNTFPDEMLLAVKQTAEAITTGSTTDPAELVRRILVERGIWTQVEAA